MGTQNKQFAGRQGSFRARNSLGQPLSRKPPAPARGRGVPLPRVHFSTPFPLPWTHERAERLHLCCKTIERSRTRGVSVRKAVRYFAWFWKDRHYRTAPHVKARFKRATLGAQIGRA